MKKTLPVFVLFLLLIFGGCASVSGDLSSFVKKFNESKSFEEISVADFYIFTKDEKTSYIHFFESNGSSILLLLTTNNEKKIISSCSVTQKGKPDTKSADSFILLVKTLISVYCDTQTQRADEILTSLNVYNTQSAKYSTKSESDPNFTYTFSYNEIGTNFLIESIRFKEKSNLKPPEISDYSQFFQTSGQ